MKKFLATAALVVGLLFMGTAHADNSFSVSGALTDFNPEADTVVVPRVVGNLTLDLNEDVAFVGTVASDFETVSTLVGLRHYQPQEDGVQGFTSARVGGQFESLSVPDVWLATLTVGAVQDISDSMFTTVELGVQGSTDFDVYRVSPVLSLGAGVNF